MQVMGTSGESVPARTACGCEHGEGRVTKSRCACPAEGAVRSEARDTVRKLGKFQTGAGPVGHGEELGFDASVAGAFGQRRDMKQGRL